MSDSNQLVHIALDLELEQPRSNPQTPDSIIDDAKIIQVGWVVFTCDPTFKVLKMQSKIIDIGVPLSEFIQKLTGITNEKLKNGITLTEAYDALVSDMLEFKTLRVVKQWGGGDMDALRKELGDSVEWEFGHSGCNVKHQYQTYAEAKGLNRSGGLSKCMGRCGLYWLGQGKHDALYDALNTAKVYNFLYKSYKGTKENFNTPLSEVLSV